jgi:tetratricopeptide (TPR) repeat protein
MARDASSTPSLAEIRIDRVMRRRWSTVSMVGTDETSGATVVLKELTRQQIRPLPPADPRRSVWTRLILPSQIESSDGRVRILRPFMDGESLGTIVERGTLPLERILEIALDVLRALDTLHTAGYVHGAVTPSNVIVCPEGRAWLTDPMPTDPDSVRVFAGGGLDLAIARYLSPEQTGVLEDPVDARSDLYSLGACLWLCLTGEPVHHAMDTGELLRAQVFSTRRSVRGAGVAAPRVLDEIVGRLLWKDPRDRYATAAGVLQDLLELERSVDAGDPDPPFVIGFGDLRSTLTEPGLVGRAGELRRVDELLARSAGGHGSLVQLIAESGDGKTRILDEIAFSSAQRGERVFRADAHELEAPRPLAMLERLAGSILDAAADDSAFTDHLLRTVSPWSSELRTVLPSLGRLFPGDDGIERPVSEHRLQEAIAELVDALGTPEHPAVLLLDDCQWADELSIGVVARWSSRTRPRRYVTIVAATREETDTDRPAVGPGNGHADGENRGGGRGDGQGDAWTEATTIVLGALSAEETKDLVSSMAGPIPEDAHRTIARLSRGRPFFVTTLLRGMVESAALAPGPRGWVMDPSALAAIAMSGPAATLVSRRLRRLPDETLGFLSAAAVLGHHASVEESAALAEIDDEDADTIVEEARRAGLIWAGERRDDLSFIHDKVREGALRRLNETERRVLHLRAATLIERTRPHDVFDLAYHYDEAGAPQLALAAALEASGLARARQALGSAETMLRIASRGVRESSIGTRRRVATDLGAILMVRGAYDEAARWLEEARALAPPGDLAAEIESTIGELAFKRGDVRTAGASIERALRMIGKRVPRRTILVVPLLLRELVVQLLHTVLPARLIGRRPLEAAGSDLLASRFYGRLGYAWWFERGKIATLWTHLRSLNLAERYGPTPELARAYSEHAPAMMLVPWHKRGIRFAQKSHSITVRLGDLHGQGRALHFWGAGLYAASAFEASLARMREAMDLLEQAGDRWEVNNCRLQMAMARYRLGDLAGAVEESKAAQRAGLEIGDAQARGIGLEGWAKATDGAVPRELIRAELERSSEDVLTIASVLQAEGMRLLGCGEASAAVEAFDESQRLFRQAGMKNAGVSPVRPWLVTALRQAAGSTPAEERQRRAALTRRARSVARQASRRARFYRNDLPHVLRERALLAALRGRRHRAAALIAQSLDVATLQGAQAEVLRTRAARGHIGANFGWTMETADGAAATAELEILTRAATLDRKVDPAAS